MITIHTHVIGIATDHIPMTYTGKVKDVYWRHWMRSRLMIEEQKQANDNYNNNIINNNTSLSTITPNTNTPPIFNSKIVTEAPYLNDILFKQTKQLTNHPGNITLRNLIQYKVKQQYEIKNNIYTNNTSNTTTTTNTTTNNTKQLVIKTNTIISEIVDTIQHNNNGMLYNNETVRFLHWNKSKNNNNGVGGGTKDKDYGWWEELQPNKNEKDRELILLKIKWLFRECAKLYRKKQLLLQQQQQAKTTSTPTPTQMPMSMSLSMPMAMSKPFQNNNQNKRKERDNTTTMMMQSSSSPSSSLLGVVRKY